MKIYQNVNNFNDLNHEYAIEEIKETEYHREFNLRYSNEGWSEQLKGKVALSVIDDGNQIIINKKGSKRKLDYSEANALFLALLISNTTKTKVVKEETIIQI